MRGLGKAPPAPAIVNDGMNLDQLILALNERTKRINQLKTDVRVSMDGAPTMRGTLLLERPKRLRMKAGIAGLNGVDIGSNNERFWIWTKVPMPGQPPTLMYARHIDFETSAIRRQIPLDPAWLIDGLGSVEFKPTDQHSGPFRRPDGRLEVHSFRQTAVGQNIRTCVIDSRTGDVVQQSFYDKSGELIAFLNSIEHRYYEDEQVSLPQRVVLNVVEGDKVSKITIDAGQYSINSLFGDPERLWAMPNPSDVNRVDLSTLQPITEPQGELAPSVSDLQHLRRSPNSNTGKQSFIR